MPRWTLRRRLDMSIRKIKWWEENRERLRKLGLDTETALRKLTDTINEHGALTISEICQILNMSENTAQVHCYNLWHEGKIRRVQLSGPGAIRGSAKRVNDVFHSTVNMSRVIYFIDEEAVYRKILPRIIPPETSAKKQQLTSTLKNFEFHKEDINRIYELLGVKRFPEKNYMKGRKTLI